MEKGGNKDMKKTHKELKHLGFVRSAVINTIVCLSSLYIYAKNNSGPLKSAVGTVEGAVTTVVSPVYDTFKGVPDHLLVFLDEKVDVVGAKFDEYAPSFAKKIASHVHEAIQKSTQIAKNVVHEAQVGGLFAAASYAAKESSGLLLDQSVKVWSKLDQFSPFHSLAIMVVPTASRWSDKYNKLITDMRNNGYTVFGYVPLIPADDIAKMFKHYKAESGGKLSSPHSQ